MSNSLNGKRVALLVTDGFEQVELTGPKQALESAGATTQILSNKSGTVKGWNHTDPADDFTVDKTFDAAQIEDYDAIVLPGGVVNGDNIRLDESAKLLVSAAAGADKVIAVICHGGWILISTDLVRGKTMTSWPSLADDLRNAGAEWVDKEVVVDGKLISSRKPDDLDAFNQALVSALEG
ncbi:type 1 glutamine amidotransferase domain-containing protein [Pseudomonas saliphila]|uniref:type 1 glutamine amidotransferase domain-containing protein n=1 Tax=Pseudomonas saliphila TaxID=2586906 RepID=UPI00123BA474|nr:type 1 glutamine amidotransferase domain-containing protein [Pseudomonas saliphila]